MRVTPVEPSDPRVGEFARLTDVQWRRQQEPKWGMFLAEGEKVIRRALAAGYRPRVVLCSPRFLPGIEELLAADDVDVLVADESVLREIVGFRLHRGALASFERKPAPEPADLIIRARRLLVLEDLVDHTNVGLVFRSAAALGIDAVLVSPGCADPYYRRSLKTSMGAVLALPWTVAEPWPDVLGWLRAQGWLLAALTPDPRALPVADGVAEAARSLAAGVALLLGSEGPGLTPRARAEVQQQWRIPMTDRVDSLNVAAAAAIACYELAKTSR